VIAGSSPTMTLFMEEVLHGKNNQILLRKLLISVS